MPFSVLMVLRSRSRKRARTSRSQTPNISFQQYLKYRIECFIVRCMNSDLVVRALSALAHESRLAIFRLLVVAGTDGMAAGEIAKQLGLSPSSLSFHLKDLSHAELVKPRQESRFIIYTANFDAMTDLIGFLTENCCAGAPCAVSGLPDCCADAA